MTEESKLSAPYGPFSTFETALNQLAAIGGLPAKIDHSVFPSMGGMAKGQVLGAFRFLGLIDAQGVPQPDLKALVLKKDERPAILRQVITKQYPNISEDDFASMSLGHLDGKLADDAYNVTGGTRQKARSFLLKAAEFSGIPLSKLLTAKGPRGPRKGGKRAAVNRTERTDGQVFQVERKLPPPGGTEKTIKLNNGGSVTLSLDVNILELKGEDRQFVFELIDRLDVYEHALPID